MDAGAYWPSASRTRSVFSKTAVKCDMVFLRSRADLPETGGTHRSAAVRDRRRHRREHAEHAQSLTARTVWYGEGISKADPLTSTQPRI